MAFNAALWSHLPLEVVEQILSFLPMSDLCRYCTTCKTWNELINNPAFSVLHVRNRNKHSPFIAIHSITTSFENGGYINGSQLLCFLDISSKKWYSMKPHDALETSLQFDPQHFRILAIDGGLMLLKALTRVSKLCYHESGCTQLCVWNPIKDMKIKLPCVTNHESDSFINFVVDDIAETFKVFVIRQDGESPVVHTYDSFMNEWKASSKLEMNNIWNILIVQSIVFQNLLYNLCFVSDINHGIQKHYELWKYNHLVDIWERLHFVEGNFVERDYTRYGWQFIVSGERLFVMYSRRHRYISHDVFEVHEIDIQSRATKVLLTWTRMQIMRIFDIDVKYYNYDFDIYGVGFNKSLMLVSFFSRNVVIFDVETKETNFKWAQLPLIKLRVGKESYSFIGKQMDFLLPGTLK
ncbi:hypothetical protein M758_12G070100 [Ceratodon purpureus]|nr:hypothetical protein M758_12G070100 [Ceratodon purpureus]